MLPKVQNYSVFPSVIPCRKEVTLTVVPNENAFLCFDGETSPVIAAGAQSLTVSYRGWVCRYETDGEIVDLGYKAANRHGHYRAFAARGEDEITVTIRILKEA